MRVAISPCPNDIFVFGPLILGRVPWEGEPLKFEFLDIEALNLRGEEDEAPDVLKCSFARFAELGHAYELCPVGAALGRGVGPLVVGRAGPPLAQRGAVLLPGPHTTAALLWRRYGPVFAERALRYDRIAEETAADPALVGVLIHEARFTYAQRGLELLLDLGAAWEQDTGLPLPLGAIALHQRLPPATRGAFSQALRRSLAYAWEHVNEVEPLVLRHAQEMDPEVARRHIKLYVNEFTRDLGEQGWRAARKLLELANARQREA